MTTDTHQPQPDHFPAQPQPAQDALQPIEIIISFILRGGVLLSGGIILLGIILYFLHAAGVMATPASLKAMVFPHTPGDVFAGLAHGDPEAVIMLGLMVLIATPVSRIAISVVAFALEKDWRYVAITSAVLLILIISFLLGKAG
jgi:uncharacterized membrane protein